MRADTTINNGNHGITDMSPVHINVAMNNTEAMAGATIIKGRVTVVLRLYM